MKESDQHRGCSAEDLDWESGALGVFPVAWPAKLPVGGRYKIIELEGGRASVLEAGQGTKSGPGQ